MSTEAKTVLNGDEAHLKPKPTMTYYSPATRAIHADDHLSPYPDVSPAMHVSTTFRYSDDPDELVPTADEDIANDLAFETAKPHIYSRLSAPNTTRFEATLSALLSARALSYSSGLSAFHALLVFLNPRRIVMGEGYHGCHGVVSIIQKLSGLKKIQLPDADDEDAQKTWEAMGLEKGDIVHIETPLNPTGEASNISYYATQAHKYGAYLTVDATFAPPPLQNPFNHGADAVMHSGTKYFGGHSDMLCGVLAVQRDDWWTGLWTERLHLGSVMGSFEGWLGLRSLRTLELRVERQSKSAEKIVHWLDTCLHTRESIRTEEEDTVRRCVVKVQHASLQKKDMHWLGKQMPRGFGPVFAIWVKDRDMARRLPSKLKLFHHATSLGGVESLVEWRKMSDPGVDERLLRVSVGVEAWEDLVEDLSSAFRELAKEAGKK